MKHHRRKTISADHCHKITHKSIKYDSYSSFNLGSSERRFQLNLGQFFSTAVHFSDPCLIVLLYFEGVYWNRLVSSVHQSVGTLFWRTPLTVWIFSKLHSYHLIEIPLKCGITEHDLFQCVLCLETLY